MTREQIKSIIQSQNSFFATGKTLPISFRKEALGKLKAALYKYEEKISGAIKSDLGKSAFESYMCETGLVINEISHMEKHIKSFAKEPSLLFAALTTVPG